MDADTARVVEQRLQWLLRENGPGPASPAASPGPETGADGDARRPRPPAPSSSEADAGSIPVPPRRVPRAAARLGSSAGPVLSVFGSFRRPHVVIVAAIVVLGILLAGWAVLRAKPVAVAVTPPTAESTASSSGVPSGSGHATGGNPTPSASAAELVVHVLGAVKKPGLVRLAAGSRVQDALNKAGGLTGKADPGGAQPRSAGRRWSADRGRHEGQTERRGPRRHGRGWRLRGLEWCGGLGRLVRRRREWPAAGQPEHRHPSPTGGTARSRSGDGGQDHRLAYGARSLQSG